MSIQFSTRRFTVHDFHRMGEAGIFSEDDRVELLDGEIIEMTPIGSRHAACVAHLTQILNRRLGETAIVQQLQGPKDSINQFVASLQWRGLLTGSAQRAM